MYWFFKAFLLNLRLGSGKAFPAVLAGHGDDFVLVMGLLAVFVFGDRFGFGEVREVLLRFRKGVEPLAPAGHVSGADSDHKVLGDLLALAGNDLAGTGALDGYRVVERAALHTEVGLCDLARLDLLGALGLGHGRLIHIERGHAVLGRNVNLDAAGRFRSPSNTNLVFVFLGCGVGRTADFPAEGAPADAPAASVVHCVDARTKVLATAGVGAVEEVIIE